MLQGVVTDDPFEIQRTLNRFTKTELPTALKAIAITDVDVETFRTKTQAVQEACTSILRVSFAVVVVAAVAVAAVVV